METTQPTLGPSVSVTALGPSGSVGLKTLASQVNQLVGPNDHIIQIRRDIINKSLSSLEAKFTQLVSSSTLDIDKIKKAITFVEENAPEYGRLLDMPLSSDFKQQLCVSLLTKSLKHFDADEVKATVDSLLTASQAAPVSQTQINTQNTVNTTAIVRQNGRRGGTFARIRKLLNLSS
jgi:hypothetical protein